MKKIEIRSTWLISNGMISNLMRRGPVLPVGELPAITKAYRDKDNAAVRQPRVGRVDAERLRTRLGIARKFENET